MADIDVGPGATDRTGNADTHGYTIICKDNPANANGTLTGFKIRSYTDLTGVKIGSFYLVSGNTYKCRASDDTVGSVTAGAERSFVVSVEVNTGDLLGFYCETGVMEMDTAGSGILYLSGDQCTADNEQTYSSGATSQYSIYAEGDFSTTVVCVTEAATLLSTEGATLNASVTGLSTSEWGVTRGFKWDTTSRVVLGDYANDWHEDSTGWYADVTWDHAVTGCDPGVPVYFRAYITTSTS